MPDTVTPTHNPRTDYERIARSLAHAKDFSDALDKYIDDPTLSEEVKLRFRTAQRHIKVLSANTVFEIDHDASMWDSWDDVVPNYIQRHQV